MAHTHSTDQNNLAQIINGMVIPTFVINKKHVVTHWNKACEQLTGIFAADMVGTRNAWKAFYTNQRPVLADLIVDGSSEETVAKYYQGRYSRSILVEEAYEAQGFFSHLGESGKWLYFTATPLKDAHQRTIGAIETFQDLTGKVLAEKSLMESEEKFRQITSSAQDAIIMVDDKGYVNFWNRSAEKIFGYSDEEMFGRELHTILAPQQFLERLIQLQN